jgi:hypothetical protein
VCLFLKGQDVGANLRQRAQRLWIVENESVVCCLVRYTGAFLFWCDGQRRAADAALRGPLPVLRAALSSIAAVSMSTERAAHSRYREGAGRHLEHGHSAIRSFEVLLALI